MHCDGGGERDRGRGEEREERREKRSNFPSTPCHQSRADPIDCHRGVILSVDVDVVRRLAWCLMELNLVLQKPAFFSRESVVSERKP